VPQICVGILGKQKISFSWEESNGDVSVVQPVA